MSIYKEKFRYSIKAARFAVEPEVKEQFFAYLKKWNLLEWEDALLFQINPVYSNLDLEDLEDADNVVSTMRNSDGTTKELYSDEVNPLILVDEIEKEYFQRRLIRTIYWVVENNFNVEASSTFFILLNRIEPILIKEVANLSKGAISLCIATYTLLAAYYFDHLADEQITYIFASELVVFGSMVGFDWKYLVAKRVEQSVNYYDRRNFCLNLAAGLADNLTVLGKKTSGEVSTCKDWIDSFRAYSHGEFDGSSLFGFSSDQNTFLSCNNDEKETVLDLLRLYTHLINGSLALSGIALEDVDKRLSEWKKNKYNLTDSKLYFNTVKKQETDYEGIKRAISKEFPLDSDGNFTDVEGVLKKLNVLSVDYNDPTIADLYYFDEQTGEFKWRE